MLTFSQIKNAEPASTPYTLFDKGYLFTDESRGTSSRTQIILIPGSGRLSTDVRTAFRSQSGFPPGPERPSSSCRTRLPPWPGRPARDRIRTFLTKDVTVQVPLQGELNWGALSTKTPSSETLSPHMKYPLLTFKF
jgi:hypothetical protein